MFGQGASQLSTKRFQRAICRSFGVAVLRKGKNAIREGLLSERMSGVVSDVASSFIEPSGSSILIFRDPEPVVSNHTIFRPLFVHSINYLFLPFILCTVEPVRPKDPTAMGTIAAETALAFLREGNPTLVVNCVLDARSRNIRED